MMNNALICPYIPSDDTVDCSDKLNFFDEQVFAHSTNGTILAIHPEHISLSESRSLGSISAVVKDWEIKGSIHQVILAVKDRWREILFRVNLTSDQTPKINLQKKKILYMRFRWDKVLEYQIGDRHVILMTSEG